MWFTFIVIVLWELALAIAYCAASHSDMKVLTGIAVLLIVGECIIVGD